MVLLVLLILMVLHVLALQIAKRKINKPKNTASTVLIQIESCCPSGINHASGGSKWPSEISSWSSSSMSSDSPRLLLILSISTLMMYALGISSIFKQVCNGIWTSFMFCLGAKATSPHPEGGYPPRSFLSVAWYSIIGLVVSVSTWRPLHINR